MSFRGKLLVFFTIIVIVPMIAVALVLFSLTKGSETGKADARIAQGLRTALTAYDDERGDARQALTRVLADRELRRDLAGGRPVGRRIRALAGSGRSVESIVLYDPRGRAVARAGARDAVAYATAAPTTPSGRAVGTLAVSVTSARRYTHDVAHLTGLEVRLSRNDRLFASTLREGPNADVGRSGDVRLEGRRFRGRLEDVREAVGPPLTIGVFDDSEGVASNITNSRWLIGGILLGFLLLTLASSVVVARALRGQVSQFLAAARRLGEGNFSKPVPIQGEDEFAALGSEFNKMSEQLAAKIEEVEGKRRELEGAMRRVGAAFAAGLDRQGIVELAIATAVDACAADTGRAVPIDTRKLSAKRIGADDPDLAAGLEAAERETFRIDGDGDGDAAPARREGDEPPDPRRLTHARVNGVHALAIPLRARLGGDDQVMDVGVVSIARRGDEFGESESELFAYLAGQASVSIENADLHETVQLQAVTDGLTGLFNVRRFHETLDGEIERSRRFGNEVGLIMLDIDDFKKINDTYGHQQGDLVLVEVAQTLREHSRDIDEPARYGGEEMAVILPGTDLPGAELLAERMRAAIEQLQINQLGDEGLLAVTASFGVASLPEIAADKDGLIAGADAALYRAKRAGKNRVERAESATAAR